MIILFIKLKLEIFYTAESICNKKFHRISRKLWIIKLKKSLSCLSGACWIFVNVISNLIILHLHINWIGNIKITRKCKCNRIELKVQFKSKLSYLWIHSCEATQLYLTDLKIKLSTKKSHIKERHHHSYIALPLISSKYCTL